MFKAALTAIVLTAVLSAPAFAAEPRSDRQGSSADAPGQKAKGPNAGSAEEYAPGQRMKRNNDPNKPGASEYAPGQQDKTHKTHRPKY